MSESWQGQSAEQKVKIELSKDESAEYNDALLLSQNPIEYIQEKLK